MGARQDEKQSAAPSTGPKFLLQYPHVVIEPYIIPFLGDPVPSLNSASITYTLGAQTYISQKFNKSLCKEIEIWCLLKQLNLLSTLDLYPSSSCHGRGSSKLRTLFPDTTVEAPFTLYLLAPFHSHSHPFSIGQILHIIFWSSYFYTDAVSSNTLALFLSTSLFLLFPTFLHHCTVNSPTKSIGLKTQEKWSEIYTERNYWLPYFWAI